MAFADVRNDQLQADNIASWQPDMQMDDVFDVDTPGLSDVHLHMQHM